MEFAKLGNTDLIVSRIGLGCMGFGDPKEGIHSWTLDQTKTKNIIKYALKNEINFFDTALNLQNGTSEQYVGKALKDLVKRDEVIVATKFYPRNKTQIQKGMTAQEHIKESIDQSLKNLGMDYIDLYVLNVWDYKTPIYDVMDGLNNVVKSGKARAIGLSNCFAWQLAEANILAEKEGFPQFNCVQNQYNLIFREEEREMIPYCHMKNIALTPYSPLAGGRLSRAPGKVTKRSELDEDSKRNYSLTQEEDEVIIKRISEIAKKYECSMTEVSLAWLLTKVTAPIVGITNKKQIDQAVSTFDLNISPEDIAYMEETYYPHKLVGTMAENNPYLPSNVKLSLPEENK